jgi:hypothetical protein
MSLNPDDDGGVAEAEFHVPASDHHGHSERPHIRVPAGMLQQVRNAANSAAFPYRKGEYGMVIRHAIMRHLKWLETLSPIPSVTRQVEAIEEIVKEDEFQSQFDTVFATLQKQVHIHTNNGRAAMAKSLLKRVAGKVQQMPAGDWADMYEQEFDRRFGNVLEGEPVSLRDLLRGS